MLEGAGFSEGGMRERETRREREGRGCIVRKGSQGGLLDTEIRSRKFKSHRQCGAGV